MNDKVTLGDRKCYVMSFLSPFIYFIPNVFICTWKEQQQTRSVTGNFFMLLVQYKFFHVIISLLTPFIYICKETLKWQYAALLLFLLILCFRPLCAAYERTFGSCIMTCSTPPALPASFPPLLSVTLLAFSYICHSPLFLLMSFLLFFFCIWKEGRVLDQTAC